MGRADKPICTVCKFMPENPAFDVLCFVIGCLVGIAAGWLAFRKRLFLDDVTGLLNQRAIVPTLRRQIRRAVRRRSSLCIALLDIDGFKVVNATFGYGAADGLLREFAVRLLGECKRTGADLLRYRSGDEFLLVLNDMDEKSGTQFLEYLARMLGTRPLQIRGRDHLLSFAFGMRPVENAGNSELADLGKGIEKILADCESRLVKCKDQHRSGRSGFVGDKSS